MYSTMKKRALGFSLVELMVVVSIMAILALVGIPSYQDTVRRNALDSQQLDLISALNQARQEAVTRNTKVTICRSTDQTSCAAVTGDWGVGWITFINTGTAGTVASINDILAKHGALKQSVAVTLTDTNTTPTQLIYLQFSGTGYLSSNTPLKSWFKLCTSDNKAINARAIIVETTGRGIQTPLLSSGVYGDITGTALTCP